LPQFKAPNDATTDIASRPFEQIYKEARIPDSPCTVDELGKLLDNPTVAAQPLNIKVVAVSLTLSAKGIGPDVPIADAVRRDRALDAYQEMLDQRAATAEQRNAAMIQQITQETEEFLKRKQAETPLTPEQKTEVAQLNELIAQAIKSCRKGNTVQGKKNPAFAHLAQLVSTREKLLKGKAPSKKSAQDLVDEMDKLLGITPEKAN